MLERQESDLASLSSGLLALKGASQVMNETLGRQNDMLIELEGTADVNNDKVRRVVRRAGRMNNGGGKGKVFKGWVTVGFEREGREYYLAAENERIKEVEGRVGGNRGRGGWKDSCVWGMYGRRGGGVKGGYNAMGFQAAGTGGWMGQGFWGGFDAGGKGMGKKQEFEVDDERNMGRQGGGTRLLSGNAGWGKGEYLRWRGGGEGGEGKLVKAQGGGDGRTEERMGMNEVGRFWVDFVDYQPPMTEEESRELKGR
ncbi:hypothetical protein TrCOL_g12333 [Triparma columacea]|uniref:t-SNARE coiled-coil homology domain-containing protein n=1 Tax=Triparma columacea TaxID=722753 RepID=A0A9W7LFC8_9STRA|nr:hypothetical protein TrCOL_g12333 [Triparma columacea]